MQLVFWVKASPPVVLRVYPTLTISLVGVYDFVVQTITTAMKNHLEL